MKLHFPQNWDYHTIPNHEEYELWRERQIRQALKMGEIDVRNVHQDIHALLQIIDRQRERGNSDQFHYLLEKLMKEYAPWTTEGGGGLTHNKNFLLIEIFTALGWSNPHSVPELRCAHEECPEKGEYGKPGVYADEKDNWKWYCGIHYRKEQ